NLPPSGETYLATPFGARRRRRATATIAEPIARTARPMTTSCERKAPVNAIATGALGELGGGALTTAAGGVVTGLVTGGAVTVVVTVFDEHMVAGGPQLGPLHVAVFVMMSPPTAEALSVTEYVSV